MAEPKKIMLGIAATMLSNCFYLSTSYIVKNQSVSPGEVTVFSALLRCVIFGLWSAKVFCQTYPGTSHSSSAWISLAVSNFAVAVTILLSYVAVNMLPLSDFIVFGFTAPVFTLMIVMIYNRNKVTVVNISMCILIVVGSSLVSQPSFLFGHSLLSSSAHLYSSYTLGIVLALTAALITGFCPVLQNHCKEVPIAYFMLGSGVAKLAIGLLCPLFGLPNHIQDTSRFIQDIGTLTLISAASMLGALFMQIAIMVSNEPILVSVTRSMEIVMALGVDMVVPEAPIDYTNISIWLKIMGSLLVTACVVGIAMSDIIHAKTQALCRRNGYTALDGEEESINSNSEGYGSIDDCEEVVSGSTSQNV